MAESPEPWLRGGHPEREAVVRQVLDALELTREDCLRWCSPLTESELNARPYGLEPVAFQVRHIARSLDRLLTYAEGAQLDESQLAGLRTELEPGAAWDALFAEFTAALDAATRRVLAFSPVQYNEPRTVGRRHLPTTVAGLLIHCAEHTQRHTGQLVTTAKLLVAMRGK